VRISIDSEAERIVLGDSFGNGSTAVLDLEGAVVGRIPLTGGHADQGQHRIYASTGYQGEVVAYDSRTLEPVWRRAVGFCGGAFAVEGGLVFEVLQCGAQRDPLVVLDAATGAPAAAPVRVAGVASDVLADPVSHRVYVSTGQHVLHVHGPAPGFSLERSVEDFDALAVDVKHGRVIGRSGDRLAVLSGSGEPRLAEGVAGPVALDATGGRLYVGGRGSIAAIDLETLREVEPVPLGEGERPLLLVVDETRRRLHAVVGVEQALSLVTFRLDGR
jgi:outer membrane protein assembly factor BamB